MKAHFCKSENTELSYEGECNWCGEKEMTKLEQAARQALEALELHLNGCGVLIATRIAYESLGEALAEQAEQDPVAWMWTHDGGGQRLEWESIEVESIWKSTPLYAHPVRTKDLTDDEIWEIEGKLNRHLREFPIEFARAVIAADRSKNK